jgi:hypothetical protein
VLRLSLLNLISLSLPLGIRDGDAAEVSSDGAIPLPDIKETLKKKEEEEKARIEEEKLKEKRRIKRSDKKALAKVRPFDESYL